MIRYTSSTSRIEQNRKLGPEVRYEIVREVIDDLLIESLGEFINKMVQICNKNLLFLVV